GKAAGVRVFINGDPARVITDYDELYKSILPVTKGFELTERPIRVAKSYRAYTGDNGIFEGSIDDIRIYNRRLTYAEVARIYGKDPLTEALSTPKIKRSRQQEEIIYEYYLA